MIRIEHMITKEEGIHAIPASMLGKSAKKYNSDIVLWKGSESADMKNLFEVMGLCVKKNTNIIIEISGTDEKMAAQEIENLIMQL